MKTCDLCNDGIEDAVMKTVSAARMRTAVRNGLKPPPEVFGFALGLGLDEKVMLADWRARVMKDESAWGLCPACHAKLRGGILPVLVVCGMLLILLAAAFVWLATAPQYPSSHSIPSSP